MLRAMLIRRQAQLFDGATSKANYFFAALCWNAAMLLGVAGLLAASVFVHQYGPPTMPSLTGFTPGGVLDRAPRLPVFWWVLVVLLDLNFVAVFVRLSRRFRQREGRMPDGGSSI